MRNPTPAPIVIPVAGTPTCRGIALTVRTLLDWTRDDDGYHLRADPCDKVLILARRAERDGAVLCLRPTNDGKGACVGMTPTAFAVASLADDFAARALVVDPYDAAGNDLRERLPESTPLTMTPEEAHMIAVWEASEAV